MLKKIGLGILIVIVLLQFIPTKKNQTSIVSSNSIEQKYNTPENVQAILKKACFDCHSNHTEYPWYSQIQPLGWWIADHVDEGKEELNFSEFKLMPQKAQLNKLLETVEMIEENEMPLESYTWIHSNAKLTAEEKELVIEWAKKSQDEILTRGKQ